MIYISIRISNNGPKLFYHGGSIDEKLRDLVTILSTIATSAYSNYEKGIITEKAIEDYTNLSLCKKNGAK
jgi:hypothetical protein